MTVIRFDRVSVTYPDAVAPVLRVVDLSIEEGELVLVVGHTGTGKSTLLGAMNGAVPHFTGGTLAGRVTVLGRDTRDHRPRDLAGLVGVVGQDPTAGFVTDTVEEELAYAMEQLALPADVMRKRVEETLDLLGLAELRNAPLATLSGGQQQRVAVGAALTAHPRVLLLDEPTSALDPTGAEEVLATITRLVHDLAVTVVLAEHRIERVVHAADRVVHVGLDGHVRAGEPSTIMAVSDVAPPIVELGRYAGWSPLPLSVRDARRRAAGLREQLSHGGHDELPVAAPSGVGPGDSSGSALVEPVLRSRDLVVEHGSVVAVREVSLDLRVGEVVALMGRNGAGKSSLLWALQGTGRRSSGRVDVADPAQASGRPTDGTAADGRAALSHARLTDPATLPADARRRLVGLVPQSPSDLLYLDTVGHECTQADTESDVPAGSCRGLLDRLSPGIPDDRHPRDLSEGQRLALVLAIALTADPPVVLLDEPTRGLDYSAKAALAEILRDLARRGRAVVVSTHDVEFVATVADRVVVLAQGEIVADGLTRDIVCASPAFAPQVAKIVAPQRLLTVREVIELADGASDER